MEIKWAVFAMVGILLAILCIWLAAMFIKWLSSLDWTFESASKRAGRHGEKIAAEIISKVLREDDCSERRNNHNKRRQYRVRAHRESKTYARFFAKSITRLYVKKGENHSFESLLSKFGGASSK